MYKKKHPSGNFSGILFLLVFFFSLNLFSSKLAPKQKADDTPENISVTALLQADAVQPQLGVSFDPAPASLAELLFSPVPSITEQAFSSTNKYVYGGPDLFSRFFYFHHSSYGDEPHCVA